MSKEHTVEIPEFYLLTIAVHGNMGDGELPDLMKAWAQEACKKLGLGDKLRGLQNERRDELERRLRNALGNELVDHTNAVINDTVKKLQRK